ncbi:MAG: glycoside hydrolase family 3 C-terminal domain-containing protein [Bacilli bacterium]|nr:glycoside hydrolase family 3 C-terminal domain-containing protein [Bacilli bacterium]
MAILNNAIKAVSRLNNKQKASLLYGNGNWETNLVNNSSIGSVVMHDGPCGLRIPEKGLPPAGSFVPNGDPSTCYPAPCLVACSWNPVAVERMTSSYAYEARLHGTDLVLTPGVNIKRNPLCGRNFEYFSEDPLLSGKMGAAYINGLQKNGVGATIKHFAANNQEFCRCVCSSEVDMRALNEIYLKPFEIAIKESDPWAVMCAYNLINGVPASDYTYLTKNTLRDKWGYDGVLMSDWGATYDSVLSHENGLDLQMPCFDNHSSRIAKAVKRNKVSQYSLDKSSERVANMYFKTLAKPELKPFDTHEEARIMAEESIVLLKNDKMSKTGYKCALPLSSYKNTCVIGALANYAVFQGDGSSKVTVAHGVAKSFLEVINEGKNDAEKVPYCQGYSYSYEKDCEYFGIDKAALMSHFDNDEKKVGEYLDAKFIAEASNMASAHDTIIIFLGLPPLEESEGFDRAHMLLDSRQITLFKTIASLKKSGSAKKIITVVCCGSPVELSFANISDAILLTYLPGEAGYEALDNIVLGRVTPSGKLAESWPLKGMDVPSYDSFGKFRRRALYKESIFVGYRYYLSAGRNVLFPFGYGLSYTTFDYLDASISDDEINKGDTIKVSVTIKNSGKYDGSEVIQVYSSFNNGDVELDPEYNVIRPSKELRAFYKVHLKKGQKKKVTIEIPVDNLAYFDPVTDSYVLEEGKYTLYIASSCENVKKSLNVIVSSDDQVVPADVDSGYFKFAKAGIHIVPNKNFYSHLNRQEPAKDEPRKFTVHSTLNDISKTVIGSIIKNALTNSTYKNVKNGSLTEQNAENYLKMVLNSPIFFMTCGGMKEKYAYCIVHMANHRWLRGLFALIIGH